MEKGKKFLKVLLYAYLIWTLILQIGGILNALIGHCITGQTVPETLKAKGFIPFWVITTMLVTAAVILCKVWKNKEKLSIWPMVLGLIGAAFALLVALRLRAALPLQIADSNVSRDGLQGLNGWALFWRHYAVSLISLITAIVSFLHFKSLRSARISKENAGYTEHFNFEDTDTLFADEDKKSAHSKNLSKKQRKELRAKENKGN